MEIEGTGILYEEEKCCVVKTTMDRKCCHVLSASQEDTTVRIHGSKWEGNYCFVNELM
jgi:hypothetical protein